MANISRQTSVPYAKTSLIAHESNRLPLATSAEFGHPQPGFGPKRNCVRWKSVFKTRHSRFLWMMCHCSIDWESKVRSDRNSRNLPYKMACLMEIIDEEENRILRLIDQVQIPLTRQFGVPDRKRKSTFKIWPALKLTCWLLHSTKKSPRTRSYFQPLKDSSETSRIREVSLTRKQTTNQHAVLDPQAIAIDLDRIDHPSKMRTQSQSRARQVNMISDWQSSADIEPGSRPELLKEVITYLRYFCKRITDFPRRRRCFQSETLSPGVNFGRWT